MICRTDKPFSHQLGRPHHTGRIDSLVGRKRHHALFVRLAQQFAEELEPIGRETTLPADGRRTSDPELAERLGVLRTHEEHGIARLKELAKENRKEYSGVLTLLLEMVALDSAKHEKMLRFAQKAVS